MIASKKKILSASDLKEHISILNFCLGSELKFRLMISLFILHNTLCEQPRIVQVQNLQTLSSFFSFF